MNIGIAHRAILIHLYWWNRTAFCFENYCALNGAHNVFWMYLYSSYVVLFFCLFNKHIGIHEVKIQNVANGINIIIFNISMHTAKLQQHRFDFMRSNQLCVLLKSHHSSAFYCNRFILDSSMRWKAHCHIQWFAKMIIHLTFLRKKKPQTIFRLKSEPDKLDWKNRLFLIWSM